jgi:hypothetical protein
VFCDPGGFIVNRIGLVDMEKTRILPDVLTRRFSVAMAVVIIK